MQTRHFLNFICHNGQCNSDPFWQYFYSFCQKFWIFEFEPFFCAKVWNWWMVIHWCFFPRMRPDLLLVALLLLTTSRADRSTNWWRGSDSPTRTGDPLGRLSSFQAAPQQPDGLKLLPQVVGETFQSKVSQFSRTPASTQVLFFCNISIFNKHFQGYLNSEQLNNQEPPWPGTTIIIVMRIIIIMVIKLMIMMMMMITMNMMIMVMNMVD